MTSPKKAAEETGQPETQGKNKRKKESFWMYHGVNFRSYSREAELVVVGEGC